MDWVTKKYLPFSFFDDEETRLFFQTISPNIKLPDRFALRRNIKGRFEELQKVLKATLDSCASKMSFTIDGWTSIAGRAYYGVTIHYIDHEWCYRSMVLDFIPSRGKHTGKDIADVFYKCLLHYNLVEKVQGITVDNAAANTTFMFELAKLMPNFHFEDQHFRCIAHILNLGIQDLMKTLTLKSDIPTEDDISEDEDQENLEEIIEDSSTATMKLRSVISKIRKSEVLRNKFRSACETAGVPTTLTPTLDCPTRWNSTHDMLGVALKLRGGINTLCGTVPELSDFQISGTEWILLERVYKLLRNFKILTTKLGGEKYVTLPFVIVSFNLLVDTVESAIKQLSGKIGSDEVDTILIVALQSARDKMLKHYKKTNWIYCSTLVLDPRHKVETFDLTPWGKELKRESLKKFEEVYQEYRNQAASTESTSTDEELQSNDEAADEELLDFNKLYSPVSSPLTTSQSSKKELEEYLDQPRAASNEDILKWWKCHQLQLPVLSKMARDFLSISATSVPAERLFSQASLVIRKHRNRLNDESARWLLCINSWMKEL